MVTKAADLFIGVDAGVEPGASGEQCLDCRLVPAHGCVVQRRAAVLTRAGAKDVSCKRWRDGRWP
jgi:hypothetical protein